MKHVEFPLEPVLARGESLGLDRREFLTVTAAAAVALVGAPTRDADAAPRPVASPDLPATATKENARQILVGPLIPVITNLKPDLSLDLDAIKFNVKYVVDHGIVTGKGVLLAAGAGGDFDILSLDERKAVSRAIVEAADGRVPVVVGAQDQNPRVCIELAKFAESIGAYGIQLSPTTYHVPSDDDVLKFFRSVHDATSKVGIMAYNTWWQNYNMPYPVIDKLLELERLVSIKWSHPGTPFSYADGVYRYAGRVSIVDNAFMCVLTHLLGGHGFITHLATVWPEHELEVWGLCEQGKYRDAMKKHATENYPWVRFRGKIAGRTSGEAPPIKAALDLTGRPGGPSRAPSRELTGEERDELRGLLRQLGVPKTS